ncbi:MAG: RNA-binding protein [Acidobacteria bacterium]|nr:RNA-binding protein [Acidobacteriota bacterium]MCB9396515.1 RNA-binding protein [Acidobacteriota bacterium]
MKLFVGNLSWGIDDNRLWDMFSAHGELKEARIVLDRETQRSRGFGFVTYANSDDAQNAIQKMNSKEVDGRAIKVNEAMERQPRERSNRW